MFIGLALGLLVGGCGDDDDESGQSDQDAIIAVIERSATSGDPEACVDSQTQKFTEQNTGLEGEAAIEQCRKDIDDSADEVEVSNIESDSDSATANVAVTGSFLDGQDLAVTLVKDGDDWKLDSIEGFVGGVDRDAFNAAFEEELSGDEDLPEGAAECLQKNVNELSDEELERFFLEPDEEVQRKVFEPCFGA